MNDDKRKEKIDTIIALAKEVSGSEWFSVHHGVSTEENGSEDVCCVSSTQGKYEWEKNVRDYIAAVSPKTILSLLRPAVPRQAISKLLSHAMDAAVRNGANSVSMPDEYVEIAAWLSGVPAAQQPSETAIHNAGDMAAIMREAADTIATMKAREYRTPIVDELQGFALMLDDLRPTAQEAEKPSAATLYAAQLDPGHAHREFMVQEAESPQGDALLKFYRTIAHMTLNHDDCALTPAAIGKELERVNKEWWKEVGCTRSHPHENMNEECERKTVEARRVAQEADCTEPDRANCPRLCGDFCNAEETRKAAIQEANKRFGQPHYGHAEETKKALPAVPTQDWFFTFCGNHEHRNGYVKIHDTYGDARKEMVRRYGDKWGFQYDDLGFKGQVERFGLYEVKE